MLNIPVGFVIYNRPDLTKKVFSAIAVAKPQTLFLIADGPRDREDHELCLQTRRILEDIDWKCDVYKNFASENMGCGVRESSGFDWVFSQVDRAIFLEDDTLPGPAFFSFCEHLLDKYADDERVMHITGNNFQKKPVSEGSYYFSRYMHAWGWASWRRAWQHYDFFMKDWPKFKEKSGMNNITPDSVEQKYWTKIFDLMHQDPRIIDTWDYQWLFACWKNNGLIATPNQNLVTNIGFGRADAVHTTGIRFGANIPISKDLALTDPDFLVPCREADKFVFDKLFDGKFLRFPWSLVRFPRRVLLYFFKQLKARV
jgi:hypothetical protein